MVVVAVCRLLVIIAWFSMHACSSGLAAHKATELIAVLEPSFYTRQSDVISASSVDRHVMP